MISAGTASFASGPIPPSAKAAALRALTPPETKAKVLERLAEFLEDVPKAWKEANQEQKNKLARQLFDEIWVKDKQVIAVKPRPELKPFFQLSYEKWLKKFESENSTPLGVASNIFSVTVVRQFEKRFQFRFWFDCYHLTIII